MSQELVINKNESKHFTLQYGNGKIIFCYSGKKRKFYVFFRFRNEFFYCEAPRATFDVMKIFNSNLT